MLANRICLKNTASRSLCPLENESNMPLNLTIQLLKTEASIFAAEESTHDEPSLFGVTDEPRQC